jgi:hypothetical protein
VLFWIIAAIIIAAIIVAWIFWANDLGRGVNPQTNVPMTPGYAPATTTGGPPPAVPANQATRPSPSTAPQAMSGATALPPPGSITRAIPPPTATTNVPASGGTH